MATRIEIMAEGESWKAYNARLAATVAEMGGKVMAQLILTDGFPLVILTDDVDEDALPVRFCVIPCAVSEPALREKTGTTLAKLAEEGWDVEAVAENPGSYAVALMVLEEEEEAVEVAPATPPVQKKKRSAC